MKNQSIKKAAEFMKTARLSKSALSILRSVPDTYACLSEKERRLADEIHRATGLSVEQAVYKVLSQRGAGE